MTYLKNWRWTVLVVFFVSAFCADVLAQKSLSVAPGPNKKNIAVINLKSGSGVTPGECELISDRLRGDLFNTDKVNVMERDQMQEILKEQGFQSSGACTDEACLVQMGQLLGVEMLVTGSLGKVGSMFLVNVRMIDVKTAKIVKVVSVDVKGDIEDVVGRLTNISELLVGAQQAQANSLNEVPAEERKKVEPKEEPVKAEIKRTKEEKNNPVVSYENEDSWKNKNRSGIRVSWFSLLGRYTNAEHYTGVNSYGYSYDNISTLADSAFSSVSKPHFSGLQAAFTIKVGPFMTIDLGSGWASAQQKFTLELGYYIGDSLSSWTDDLNIFSFNTGVNFVKRWYPFKLNIGLLFNINYLNYAEHYVQTAGNGYYTMADTTVTFDGFNVSYGLRTGIEYLIGKHIGISVDLDFIYSHFETLANTYDYSNGATENVSQILDIPPISLGIGINFYY
jgi:TolB-like protein